MAASLPARAQFFGLTWPAFWPDLAPWDVPIVLEPLPSRFDWDELFPAQPVRSQALCGSCWAFASIAALEYQVLIQERRSVDLSEDWLLDCNREGWNCDLGFAGHNYYTLGATELDLCNTKGAPLEAADPYDPGAVNCGCQSGQRYFLDGWTYIGISGLMSTTEMIKHSILHHGPVVSAVNAANWDGYPGGVFSACLGIIDPYDPLDPDTFGIPNHMVLITGWDDALGDNGAWRIRNQWGTDWSDAGYMWIPYGCSWIGFGAHYLNYHITGDGIWVDQANSGDQDGSYWQPFRSITQAVGFLNEGGNLSIKTGNYHEVVTLGHGMTLMGFDGPVVVGAP
jgi:C1A family cysteine protease